MITAKDLKLKTHDLTILYAEDEQSLRENMQNSLERLFEKVLIAKNGAEAFELFQSNAVDLILTDINMPIMTGIDLIEKIKTEHEDNTPPVIVLTAYNENNYLLDLINLNIDGFLLKPTEKTSLINILHKVTSNIQNKRQLEKMRIELMKSNRELTKQNRILHTKLDQIAKDKNQEHQLEKNNFDTLSHEEIDELALISTEMDAFINILFNSDSIDERYLQIFFQAMQKYSAILSNYDAFAELAMNLLSLAKAMQNNAQKLKSSQKDAALFFESLQFSLETFRINILMKQENDPKFYNKSIISDIQMITNFFNGVI